MDTVMQKHMSMNKHPRIEYRLAELNVLKGRAGTSVECEAKGDLAVSGTTNQFTMPVTITKDGGEHLKISGKITLKMTSFKIDPPRATTPMGLLKMDDNVKLTFEWVVKKMK